MDLTVEELIETLKRTSLPTVVVEGDDDIIVYRRLEDRFSDLGVSVLPVGGRDKVLGLFDRRGEIGAQGKFVFIADRDTWVYTSIPAEYTHDSLIFTAGYSIENDVFSDGNLDQLLVGGEMVKFLTELEEFTAWYAIALNRHMADSAKPYKNHPDHVLNPAQYPALTALEPGEIFPDALYQSVLANYKEKLRGKSLMSLLVRNTNGRRGQPHHTTAGLIEYVATRPGQNLERVAKLVGELIV